MAFDFPANPIPGQKYISGSNSYVWNGYGWSSEPPTAYVKIAGDQMTGPLGIRTLGTGGHLNLDNTTATDPVPITFRKNNLMRWSAGAGPGPEPGADVNSDWHFRRYNDAGTIFGDIPLKINRKTGRASLAFNPVDPMDIATKQFVEATMGGGGPEHVLRGGDVMTGPLTSPTLIVNAASGGQADVYGENGGVLRWLIRMTDNFELHKYTDIGAYGGSPMQISRANGNVNFTNQVAAGSMWTSTGYASNFSSDSASIGNCSSGGTFSLNVVNCGAFTASSITDYGTLTVQSTSYLNGDVHAANVIYVGGEVCGAASRPDQQLILRSVPNSGLIRINQWGAIIHDFGIATKPGVYAQARGHYFNIDFNEGDGQTGLWIDNNFLGNFAFTSDYRIKKDVVPLASKWATVKALNPVSYTQAEYTPAPTPNEKPLTGPAFSSGPLIKADNIERWGFIAHELQDTLIKSAATGEKDAPNLIQSPNPWTVIAALTKTLQEAMQRIEMLESRLGIS